VTCRILKVSTSGFYEWRTRQASTRDRQGAELANTIAAIYAGARQTYGVRRVHAELRHGHGLRISHKRVWRCMKLVGLQGVHRRRWRRHRPAEASWPDLSTASSAPRGWVTDITQHRSAEGWVYAAVVLDVYSRRVMGWSIADHLRTELVADAQDMARLRRKPVGTVVHTDRGTQYTSWLFGHRLREAACWASWAGGLGVRQRHDRVILRLHADRAPRPPRLEDPCRARDGDLPVHRSVLQPRAPPRRL
jgi:putative transposase